MFHVLPLTFSFTKIIHQGQESTFLKAGYWQTCRHTRMQVSIHALQRKIRRSSHPCFAVSTKHQTENTQSFCFLWKCKQNKANSAIFHFFNSYAMNNFSVLPLSLLLPKFWEVNHKANKYNLILIAHNKKLTHLLWGLWESQKLYTHPPTPPPHTLGSCRPKEYTNRVSNSGNWDPLASLK